MAAAPTSASRSSAFFASAPFPPLPETPHPDRLSVVYPSTSSLSPVRQCLALSKLALEAPGLLLHRLLLLGQLRTAHAPAGHAGLAPAAHPFAEHDESAPSAAQSRIAQTLTGHAGFMQAAREQRPRNAKNDAREFLLSIYSSFDRHHPPV